MRDPLFLLIACSFILGIIGVAGQFFQWLNSPPKARNEIWLENRKKSHHEN